MTGIRLLGDRVLVALRPKTYERDAATGYSFRPKAEGEGGILVATDVESYDLELGTTGVIVAIGNRPAVIELNHAIGVLTRAWELGTSVTLDGLTASLVRLGRPADNLQVDDLVAFAAQSGHQFEWEGVQYVVLWARDILAVIGQKATAQ